MKSDMGITPDVPGTGPVTDVPQPGNNPYRNEPGGPDIPSGGDAAAEMNPFNGSPTGGTGGINPSGPTTGTEDWGGDTDNTGTRSAPEGRRSSETSNPENIRQQGEQNVDFRCSELHPDCKWEASGGSVDELMPQIEQHGREKHGLQAFGQEIREKIQNLVKKRAA